MIDRRQDPEVVKREQERQLRRKQIERAIYSDILALQPDRRFQSFLDNVGRYRADGLEGMASQAVTDLLQLGRLQGRAQALEWLTDIDDVRRRAVSLDKEIQQLEDAMRSDHKPLSERMADTTRRLP